MKVGPILSINLMVAVLQAVCYGLYLDIDAKGHARSFEHGPVWFFAHWGLPILWAVLLLAVVEKKIRGKK